MTYQWTPGRRYPLSAEVVGQRIADLSAETGVCPPGRLVDDARPEHAPLHPLFEWDDAIAAEHYRVDQARQVIRSIRIVVDDEPAVAPPAFVSVRLPSPDQTTVREGYLPSEVAMRDLTLREQVLRDTLAQLQGLRRRHASLAEFAPVWAAVDQVAAEVSHEEPVTTL